MTIGQDATRLMAQLFPRWSNELKNNDELALCWANEIDRIARKGLSPDQVMAVVRRHRVERAQGFPVLSIVSTALLRLVQEQRTARSARPPSAADAPLVRHIRSVRGLGHDTAEVDCVQAYYRDLFSKFINGASGAVPAALVALAEADLVRVGMQDTRAHWWASTAAGLAAAPKEEFR